ncbi:hypothetical protein [Microbacterium hydrocarbonoxydans]|uniref:hypothetical protein n=1 Tax=Microbacterium hydrocarbonoxydans TaxID=273678 RepID=UPI00203DCA0E|nr:hypothetical protein [Microbacterium hydrocarbonoxydans]MCM3778793.1 hypothetical protein [Microbacterium hydrocarbonoxydans]
MNPVRIILSLVPLVAYGLLSRFLVPGWAALICAVLALLVVLTDLRGGIKLVPLTGAVMLSGLAVIGFVVSPDAYPFLEAYAHGIAVLLVGLVILATASTAPFTAAYAKQSVPEQYWTSPTFLSTNRRISTAWGLAVTAIGVAHLIAGAITASGASLPIIEALLNWGVEIWVIIHAYIYTQRTAAAAGHDSSTATTA